MHQSKSMIFTLALTIVIPTTVLAKSAFLIIDVQNCFVPNGTLAIASGLKVVEPINKILKSVKFDLVVRSQDWHCKNHVSFASQHKGKAALSLMPLEYTADGKLCGNYPYNMTKKSCSSGDIKYSLNQTMWPDHCVIGTEDAKFVKAVNYPSNVITVRKGYHCQVDSYSAFFDNGGFSSTELDSVLKKHGITQVYVAGLATDYCVSYTAKDAKKLGYQSTVVEDASAHIAEATLKAQKAEWASQGVKVTNTDDVIKYFNGSSRGARMNWYVTVLGAVVVLLFGAFL